VGQKDLKIKIMKQYLMSAIFVIIVLAVVSRVTALKNIVMG